MTAVCAEDAIWLLNSGTWPSRNYCLTKLEGRNSRANVVLRAEVYSQLKTWLNEERTSQNWRYQDAWRRWAFRPQFRASVLIWRPPGAYLAFRGNLAFLRPLIAGSAQFCTRQTLASWETFDLNSWTNELQYKEVSGDKNISTSLVDCRKQNSVYKVITTL